MNKVQKVWNGFPKELKVFVYVIGAAVLEQLAKDLNVNFFYFLPVVYQLPAYNLFLVLVVETAKRLRDLRK